MALSKSNGEIALLQLYDGMGTKKSPNKMFNEQTMAVHVRYKSLYIS